MDALALSMFALWGVLRLFGESIGDLRQQCYIYSQKENRFTVILTLPCIRYFWHLKLIKFFREELNDVLDEDESVECTHDLFIIIRHLENLSTYFQALFNVNCKFNKLLESREINFSSFISPAASDISGLIVSYYVASYTKSCILPIDKLKKVNHEEHFSTKLHSKFFVC